MKTLLVNPPVYDFTAYDFWLRPYGLLSVAGLVSADMDLYLFDFMDRFGPFSPSGGSRTQNRAAKGPFYSQKAAKPAKITAYEMLGHPGRDIQDLRNSIIAANKAGIKVMLSDFSPLPGTPDGEKCRKYVDLDEPLSHNKTWFPIKLLGWETVNEIKQLCKDLNRRLVNIRKPAE